MQKKTPAVFLGQEDYWRRVRLPTRVFLGFPGGSDSEESTCNAGYLGSISGLGRFLGGGHGNPLQCSCLENPHRQRSQAGYSPWGCKESDMAKQWYPTPVLLPGKSHGWRSLVGCSPWGLEESDRTERCHFHFSLSCIGEGNGKPLQCSCLQDPRDGGAWWAAVYGVAQSRTRLKRLSSRRGDINTALTYTMRTIRECY